MSLYVSLALTHDIIMGNMKHVHMQHSYAVYFLYFSKLVDKYKITSRCNFNESQNTVSLD